MSDAGIFRFLKLKGQFKTSRILLVHSQLDSVNQIKSLLKSTGNMMLIQRACSPEIALEHLQKDTADLIITEFDVSGMFNLSFVKSLRRLNPHARIIVLSKHDEVRFINEILMAGIQGYLLYTDLDRELSVAIEHVVAGKRFISFELDKLLVHLIDSNEATQ